MTGNERELGAMSVLLDELKADIGTVNQRLDDLTVAVQGIRESMAEIRGGWKALTVLSGLAGAFIGALVAFATNIGSALIGRGR